jgi:CRP/FNR family transcriptional regulator
MAAVIRADPRLAWRLLERMARRVRELVGRLDGRSGLTVAERLAGHLLAQVTAVRKSGDTDLRLGQTQADLAEDLGTVREVVVRELGRLCATGILVRVGRGRFRITDRAGLELLARGERT